MFLAGLRNSQVNKYSSVRGLFAMVDVTLCRFDGLGKIKYILHRLRCFYARVLVYIDPNNAGVG